MYKAGKNGSRDHVDKDGKIFALDCHQVELKRETVIIETETVIAERKITVSVSVLKGKLLFLSGLALINPWVGWKK